MLVQVFAPPRPHDETVGRDHKLVVGSDQTVTVHLGEEIRQDRILVGDERLRDISSFQVIVQVIELRETV